MRVHLNCRRMTLHQADVLEYYLRNVDGVREVSVFDRTQDAVIVYRADRAALVHALAAFSFDKAETMDLVPDHTTRKLNREFEDKLSWTVNPPRDLEALLPAPRHHGARHLSLDQVHPRGPFRTAARQALRRRARRHRRHRVDGARRLLNGKLRDVHAPPRRNPRGLDAQEVRRGPRGRHVAQR